MGTLALKSCRALTLALALLLAAASAPEVGAAERLKKKPAGELPLNITAARLEADQKEGVIVFTGQVKAQHGDATLYADQLRVYFQAATPAGAAPPSPGEEKARSPLGELGGEKITRIVAQGQVRFVQQDRVATGQEAIYYKDREEVVLLGNPQLWRAENTLKGERIVFNLKDNKMLVEGSSQKRVEAHLYSAARGAGGREGLPLGPRSKKSRQP